MNKTTASGLLQESELTLRKSCSPDVPLTSEDNQPLWEMKGEKGDGSRMKRRKAKNEVLFLRFLSIGSERNARTETGTETKREIDRSGQTLKIDLPRLLLHRCLYWVLHLSLPYTRTFCCSAVCLFVWLVACLLACESMSLIVFHS
mmetsp:Transcript_53166/g.104084  ORF Transcript_53166/g.104084 Transcript_53166/m.104084 type:complete len:146 (-) Transcript_53166:359-796(-)